MKDALHRVETGDATEVAMPVDVAVIAPDLENTPSLGSKTAPAAALLLAACGGGGGGDSGGSAPPPAATVLKPATDAEAARFILQASLSVSTAEIASIRSIGFEPWLDEQINAPIAQTGVAWLASRGYDQVTSANFFDNEYPGDYMIWNQLLSQPNGVRKRVALALSEFFVVSLTGLDFSWRSQAIAFHWDQLNANAFGNFRKMLEDVTLNPAMGYYLSTRGNRKEDTRDRKSVV